MSIISLNFIKMEAEKKSNAIGKVNITNNISINEVSAIKLSLGQNVQDGLKFRFEFISKYNPDLGLIRFNGELVALESEDLTKEILDEWKKNKALKKEVMANYLNHILGRCNIEALILSKEINLPPPIPLPKVEAEVENKKS
jgi:hypothetical protein